LFSLFKVLAFYITANGHAAMAGSVASLLALATGSHWTLIRYSRMLGKGATFLSAARRPLFFNVE